MNYPVSLVHMKLYLRGYNADPNNSGTARYLEPLGLGKKVPASGVKREKQNSRK